MQLWMFNRQVGFIETSASYAPYKNKLFIATTPASFSCVAAVERNSKVQRDVSHTVTSDNMEQYYTHKQETSCNDIVWRQISN